MSGEGVSPLEVTLESVRATASHYNLLPEVKYAYGTAGFRCKADILPPAAYRMGLLAALRAKSVKATIGVMVTASHNPPEDNGLKVVEPQGEMLLPRWEHYSTQLSNTDSASLVEVLQDFSDEVEVTLTSTRGKLVVGRDTRDSGPDIVAAVTAGAQNLQCKVHNIGVCTTPQLHWIVKQTNISKPNTLQDYYRTFAESFIHLYGKDDVKQSIKVKTIMAAQFAYQEEYEFTLKLVQEVSQKFTAAFHSIKHIETKSFGSDLVTKTDQAVEAAIFSAIRTKYPSDNTIGEESSEGAIFDNRRTWIVDPIDGTTNFVHSNPECCICIGFTVGKTPEFGVIYCPILRDLYTGRRGFGAALNGRTIRVSGTAALNRALVSTYVIPSKGMGLKESMESIQRVSGEGCCHGDVSGEGCCRGLRLGGSSAIMICQLAAGNVDGFWLEGLHIWDMAAAVVIASEAGGVVISTVPGEEFDLTRRRVVVASTEQLAEEIRDRIVRAPDGIFKREHC